MIVVADFVGIMFHWCSVMLFLESWVSIDELRTGRVLNNAFTQRQANVPECNDGFYFNLITQNAHIAEVKALWYICIVMPLYSIFVSSSIA